MSKSFLSPGFVLFKFNKKDTWGKNENLMRTAAMEPLENKILKKANNLEKYLKNLLGIVLAYLAFFSLPVEPCLI